MATRKMIGAAGVVLLLLVISGSFPSNSGFCSDRSMTGGIQEAIDALPPGGGTVFVPAGIYLLKASVKLRSDVHLTGEGFATVLRHVDETKSSLAQDAAAGQNQVVVTSAAGFEIGMDVIVKDDDCNAAGDPNLRTITAISGNTITLDDDLDRTMLMAVNGLVVNAFPVIRVDGYDQGTTYSNIVIENLKIEGNRDNVFKYTFQQAGIVLVRTRHSTVRNVWVDRSNYEGISDQGVGSTWNTISDNLITESNGKGIHLGTINRHFTVSGNRILDSTSDGIYFCNIIQYGHLLNNFISGNGGSGMAGIDHSGTDGDNYNVIEGNVITLNGLHGIEAIDSEDNTIINNVISHNSQAAPGASSGIYLSGVSGFTVSGNEIVENDGPGIFCSGSDLTLVNNLVAANQYGGLYFLDSTAPLTNMTIAANLHPLAGGGILCDNSILTVINSILWGNAPDQLYLESGGLPTVSYSDIENGLAGTGNIDEDPLFVNGPMGDFYLSQTLAGQAANSPCIDTGGDLAGNICFTVEAETICLDQLTTSSSHGPEAGSVDMGFHYETRRYRTISADLNCTPAAGTLPFTLVIGCTLTNNYEGLNRQGKAVLSIQLAGDGFISNWRSGTVGLGPGENFKTGFSQTIPALASMRGTSSLLLTVDDVTPPPYNQPPYPPSGDRDSDGCTVIGVAP